MFPRKKLFFQYEIWNSFAYILYVHKKKIMFFQCGIKKLFGLNTSTENDNIISFQYGI